MDRPELARVVRERLGREIEAHEDLAAGLGLRRFVRLHLDGPPGRVIARIEADEDPAGRPADVAPEPALEPIRSVLEAAGLPVPRSHAHLPDLGLDLLEDLGDESLFVAASREPTRTTEWLREACALLPRLQSVGDPGGVPAFSRRLDAALFTYKGALFARHSLPLALARPARATERRVVEAAFERIAGLVEPAPLRLSHRDFQSQNLLLREDGSLVMIDLQGAFLAPPEYDLVCLLRDSYLDVGESSVSALVAETRAALPDPPSPDEFDWRFDLLTLTRKGKDHARFLDVGLRRDDPRWLAHLPITGRVLAAAAARAAERDAAFADLAELLAALPTDDAEVRRRLEGLAGSDTEAPCGR
ncbi:MAG: phosphotransferase [Myxococcota bacterium]|nr:phosphotransferase [Myxococcota bacterium]